jgi:hypothetical protein
MKGRTVVSLSRDELSGLGDGRKPPGKGWWVLAVLVVGVGLAGLPVVWLSQEWGAVLGWLVTVGGVLLQIVRDRRPPLQR